MFSVLYLYCISGVTKDLGNSVFHTGTTTEDPDSSSSEESDIECKLSSDEEEAKKHEIKALRDAVTFNVSLYSI